MTSTGCLLTDLLYSINSFNLFRLEFVLQVVLLTRRRMGGGGAGSCVGREMVKFLDRFEM